MATLDRVLKLSPKLGEAHVLYGWMIMLRQYDFVRAEAEITQGLALSPNYTHGHHVYSHLLLNLGRYDESLVESRKFLELDPLFPAANLHLGQHYVAARQWELAITGTEDAGYGTELRQGAPPARGSISR